MVLEVCALSCDFPASNPLVKIVFPGIADRIKVKLYILVIIFFKKPSLSNDSSYNDLLLGVVESIDLYRYWNHYLRYTRLV